MAAYNSRDYVTASEKFIKAATAVSPSLDEFLEKARPLNPGVSEDALTEFWNKHFGPVEVDRTKAQFYLGLMYDNGKGVPQDYNNAIQWFTKAAEGGHDDAQFYLGMIYDKGRGVRQDYQQAVRWYTKAADAGFVVAQFNLGQLHEKGRGVPQDNQEAAYWFTKAADAGLAEAQVNLAAMYFSGKGVPQDYVLAHMWANLAASQGDKESIRKRAAIAASMTPNQLAEAQKLVCQWKPTSDTSSDSPKKARITKPVATGTGFVVSSQGHILTNYHVIEGCQSVRGSVEGRTNRMAIVGSDAENDLAVLKLSPSLPSVARFREGRTIRPGDGVVGFPFAGLLASEAQVTTGTVSALAGIGNNTRFLQITAPVQPGNSGGPVLDQSGNIVGVVVSKLNALTIAKTTGDIPQNINFAINGAVAKAFLDSQNVEYETTASTRAMGSADVAAAARKFTLLIECYR